jgi:hypothetical protein
MLPVTKMPSISPALKSLENFDFMGNLLENEL